MAVTAMAGADRRNEITVRTKLRSACGSIVAGEIKNVTRLRDLCVDDARQLIVWLDSSAWEIML